MAVDPSEQLQVGDRVLYVDQGVITTVSGYVWQESLGSPPRIGLYVLSCGISAPRGALQRWEGASGSLLGEQAQAGGEKSAA